MEDKLKGLYNRHTETRSGRRRSVQVPYNFWINCLYIESLIKLANMLRRSMHRRCLRDYHCFVL